MAPARRPPPEPVRRRRGCCRDPRRRGPAGLVGFGADLAPETLVDAYRRGICPVAPRRRGACPGSRPTPAPSSCSAARCTSSRSLARGAARSAWETTVDAAFAAVVAACADRPAATGTWITGEMAPAYVRLHRLGWAHSLEVWDGDDLVGGLYGVAVGGCFTGESMFHRRHRRVQGGARRPGRPLAEARRRASSTCSCPPSTWRALGAARGAAAPSSCATAGASRARPAAVRRAVTDSSRSSRLRPVGRVDDPRPRPRRGRPRATAPAGRRRASSPSQTTIASSAWRASQASRRPRAAPAGCWSPGGLALRARPRPGRLRAGRGTGRGLAAATARRGRGRAGRPRRDAGGRRPPRPPAARRRGRRPVSTTRSGWSWRLAARTSASLAPDRVGDRVGVVAAELGWPVAGDRPPGGPPGSRGSTSAAGAAASSAGPRSSRAARRPMRPAWVRAASTASRSTRSFIGSSLWPLTQRKRHPVGSARTASISGSHRSRLATGFLALFIQPRASQPSHHRSRKQLTT